MCVLKVYASMASCMRVRCCGLRSSVLSETPFSDPGMLQAGVGQKRLKCNIFKTLFRSARLGRVQGVAAARSAETTTTSDVAGT